MDASIILGTLLEAAGFGLTIFINFQAAIGPDSEYSLGWFKSTVGNLSAKYPNPITPAGYAFSIWSLIYLWMAAWILYFLINLCRTNIRGPVYLNPPAASLPFLLTVFLANALNNTWLFVWDRECLTGAAIVLVSSSLVLYLALFLILTSVHRYLAEFYKIARGDLWAYRILAQNGVAIYTAWVTIAAQVNVCTALLYAAGMPSDTAIYICLSVLAFELLVFFALDVSLLEPYTRYVFTIYPVFIWALSAVLVANSDEPYSPQFIYSAVLLGLSVFLFITKTLVTLLSPSFNTVEGKAGYKFKQLI